LPADAFMKLQRVLVSPLRKGECPLTILFSKQERKLSTYKAKVEFAEVAGGSNSGVVCA
jgi:hypothetical protein